jgi:hypothetical protein
MMHPILARIRWGDAGLGCAPLQRVQAQIRHKQGSLRATPHLFRFELELASAPH